MFYEKPHQKEIPCDQLQCYDQKQTKYMQSLAVLSFYLLWYLKAHAINFNVIIMFEKTHRRTLAILGVGRSVQKQEHLQSSTKLRILASKFSRRRSHLLRRRSQLPRRSSKLLRTRRRRSKEWWSRRNC